MNRDRVRWEPGIIRSTSGNGLRLEWREDARAWRTGYRQLRDAGWSADGARYFLWDLAFRSVTYGAQYVSANKQAGAA